MIEVTDFFARASTRSPLFAVIPTEAGRFFPPHVFQCAACAVEGPWQSRSMTQVDETKLATRDRLSRSHPDRSGPAFSCAQVF